MVQNDTRRFLFDNGFGVDMFRVSSLAFAMFAAASEVVFRLLGWVKFETGGGLAQFRFLSFIPSRVIVSNAFEYDSVVAV